jgi:hypothetical protein
MKSPVWRTLSVLLLLGIGVSGAFAQKYEVHPYAGGMFLSDFGRSDFTERRDFTNPGTYGVKGGVFVTDNIAVEGNVAYISSLAFRENPLTHRIRGVLWEGGGTYDMFRYRVAKVHPFVTLGLGAISLRVHSGAVGNFDNAQFAMPIEPVMVGPGFIRSIEPFIVTDGDTFFNFSYGGGVKGERLWGPLGFRADVRGRTMPNFYGDAVSGLEMTVGALFSWGER